MKLSLSTFYGDDRHCCCARPSDPGSNGGQGIIALMRIVHVANFHGPASGALATTLEQLGRAYRRAGHQYFVIAPGPRQDHEHLPWGTRHTIAARSLVGDRYRPLAVDFGVRRLLAELAPDSLEVSDRLTMRRLGGWAQKHGIPATVVSLGPPAEWTLQPGLLAPYRAVVSSHEASARRFEAILPGRVIRVDPGVDLEVFSPLRWSAKVRSEVLDRSQVLLTHVGRLSNDRMPLASLDALRTLRARGVDARLVVVGAGPLRGRVERAAVDLPVSLLGRLDDRHELAVLLASSDAMLSPATHDVRRLSGLEALASGTPVALGSTGIQLADAVQGILAQPTETRRSDARALAAQFGWRSTTARMIDLHESLAGVPSVA
jgi:alpha-1,6-mannosyltransferase